MRRRRYRPARSLFAFDRALGVPCVAGVDEAGRGCLAGPLVVAAVAWNVASLDTTVRRRLGDLDDSKRLSAAVRERLAGLILRHADQVVVMSASAATIDNDGMQRTNVRLLGAALAAISPIPDLCLVDGRPLAYGPEHRALVGGDRTSASVAAASVIAKVTRDRLMMGPAAHAHPGYGFDQHVGYATRQHRDALQHRGPSSLHRMSFRSPGLAD